MSLRILRDTVWAASGLYGALSAFTAWYYDSAWRGYVALGCLVVFFGMTGRFARWGASR